jgi:hypothetical protein
MRGATWPRRSKRRLNPEGEGGQEDPAILAVLQRVERAGQCGLEVAQHGVDPLELGQVHRLKVPTTRGRWMQPASVTAAKQPRPPLRTTPPGARRVLARLPMAGEVKPLTTSSFKCVGRPLSFSDSAATNGTWFSELWPA